MIGATALVWVMIRFSFKLVTAMNATSVITEGNHTEEQDGSTERLRHPILQRERSGFDTARTIAAAAGPARRER
jgi:hypothetical protein